MVAQTTSSSRARPKGMSRPPAPSGLNLREPGAASRSGSVVIISRPPCRDFSAPWWPSYANTNVAGIWKAA